MNCREARDAMLVADYDALAGHGSGELASHISSCANCAGLAAALLGDLRMLAAAIDARRRRRVRRTAIGVAVPVAVAAMVVMFLVPRHREAVPGTAVNSPAASVVSVDAGPNQVPTIIGTADPKVTIVLLSPGDAP